MLNNQLINIFNQEIEQTYLIIGLIVLVALIVAIILFVVLKSNKKPKKTVDMDFILTLFDKSNIIKVDYIRNKIVMDFKDVEKVDVESLHQRGAQGVSIIGDRIKFYFDGGEEKNLAIFNQIKYFIEG